MHDTPSEHVLHLGAVSHHVRRGGVSLECCYITPFLDHHESISAYFRLKTSDVVGIDCGPVFNAAVFGENGEKGIVFTDDGAAKIVDVNEVGLDGVYVHDAHADEVFHAFALSRITQASHGVTPIGVLRDVDRPVYDEQMTGQLEAAIAKRGAGDLDALLSATDTWEL